MIVVIAVRIGLERGDRITGAVQREVVRPKVGHWSAANDRAAFHHRRKVADRRRGAIIQVAIGDCPIHAVGFASLHIAGPDILSTVVFCRDEINLVDAVISVFRIGPNGDVVLSGKPAAVLPRAAQVVGVNEMPVPAGCEPIAEKVVNASLAGALAG